MTRPSNLARAVASVASEHLPRPVGTEPPLPSWEVDAQTEERRARWREYFARRLPTLHEHLTAGLNMLVALRRFHRHVGLYP
jgi:hypothetical protein